MTDYRAVLDTLAAAGWTVRERTAEAALSPTKLWPEALRRRYPAIPSSLTDFLSRVDACVNPDETAWFLTAADYAGTSDFAFAWNEWERMELESYEEDGDAEGAAAVREFWDAYLPFYLDVGGDYAYFAVRVTEPRPVVRKWWQGLARKDSEPRLGAVVFAAEDFRSVSEVAGSFEEFLGALATAVRNPGAEGPLSGLV